jgi:phage protein D
MPTADFENPLVPDFRLLVNGRPLPDEVAALVLSVTVDDEVDLPGMFAFEVAAPSEGEGAYDLVDDPLFDVGGVVEVQLGYADDVSRLIVGEITGLEPEIVADAPPTLTVRGFDRRHRLTRGRRTRSFLKLKDSDIAARVARDAGLSAEVEDSEVTHEYVLQANQTDMEFLLERAGRIHFEVGIDDRTLLFRRRGAAGDPAATLHAGDDLIEFHPRLSSVNQVSEVSVRGWSPAEKKAVVGRASAGDAGPKMGGEVSGAELAERAFGAADAALTALPVMTQAEADQLARGRLTEKVLGLVTCEGVCWGRTDVRPGRLVEVAGVGRRFGGQYYVTSANHRVAAGGGYQTRFTARRSAT